MALFKRNREGPPAGRRCVLVLSDMHAGHRFGLYDPETVLIRAHDDGSKEEWTPEPTDTQRLLWSLYLEHVEQARAWADGCPLVVFHGGDATQGRVVGKVMADVTLSDQRTIAVNNLGPVARLPGVTAIRLVTGTEIHVPQSAEARITSRLKARTGIDTKCFHHHIVTLDGARLDVSHHGPCIGSRDWLKGNVALYHLKDRIYTDRRLGRRPAHVYLYGHYHAFVEVPYFETWQGERHEARALVVPSYCGLGDHARKITKSVPYLQIGMVGIEVEGGRVRDVQPFVETLDLRTEEAL